MFEFQEKRKIRQLLYSWVVILPLFFLIVLVGKGAWSVYQKKVESVRNIERESIQLAALEERKKVLDFEIKKLSTEEGVENEIRQKYQVSKEGEYIAVIIEPTSQVKEATTTEKRAWWKFWR